MSGKRISQILRRGQAEDGQALVELIVTMLTLALLITGVLVFGFWWWHQYVAATAIQDGTAAAAFHGGNVGIGAQATQNTLDTLLGGLAPQGSFQIVRLQNWRAVRGAIHYTLGETSSPLPFPALEVRAKALKRYERFYGGPPQGGFE